ncbi:MAG: MBL fold metallo-hydrolase [Chloroflexota bacterium]
MLLKFWGTRGSIPVPLRPDQIQLKIIEALEAAGRENIDLTHRQSIEKFVAGLSLKGSTVGSNTACVTIELKDDLIIFDAGSGIRELGEALMDKNNAFAQKYGFYQGKGHASIFFTHTHWDHIQGFPFFNPVHVPGNTFDIYHVHDYVPAVLARQMEPETCPVHFSRISDSLKFHKIAEGEVVEIGGATITNIELRHPNKAYAYRVENDVAVAVLATDGEYTNLGHAGTKKYRDFYANADLLVFDAMYSVRESFIKEDWGHSSALIGVDIAKESNVKSVYFFHHDTTTPDEGIMKVLQEAREYLGPAAYPQIFMAQEGLEIEVGNSVPGADFEIDEVVENGVIVFTLSGKFGSQATEQFRQHLAYNLETHQTDKVVLKMKNLSQLTMAGIRALVETRKDVLSLALVGVPDNIYRIFELAGTTDFFAIYDDVEAALSALDPRRR